MSGNIINYYIITMLITWTEYKPEKTVVPVPKINVLQWHWGFGADTIRLEATYNQADRWILDYEPEIYLYLKKTRDWGRNHIYETRATQRIAHTPLTDSSWVPISIKKPINPRLNAYTNRPNEMVTERQVDWTKPNMRTVFKLRPFQFIWSVSAWTNWVWAFPVPVSDWNKASWTERPSTLSSRTMWRQASWAWKQNKVLVAYFKTVIKNPNWWFPIESDITPAYIIYPDTSNVETSNEYHCWKMVIWKHTR